MCSIFIYSDTKCINAAAKFSCKTCEDVNICIGCAKGCHEGHAVQSMNYSGQKCGCIHENPFISIFLTMLKPSKSPIEIIDSKSIDNTPDELFINIADNDKE